MNDRLLKVAALEEGVIADCESALESVLRSGGDRAAVVRQCVERVLALPKPAFADARVRLLLSLARASNPGNLSAVLPLAERIVQEGALLEDPSASATALNVFGVALEEGGQLSRAMGVLLRTAAVAVEVGNEVVECGALINMALLLQKVGCFREARRMNQRAKERATALGQLGPQITARGNLAYAKLIDGQLQESLQEAHNALAMVPAFPSSQFLAQRAFGVLQLHGIAAVVQAELGNAAEAETHLERGREWSERSTETARVVWEMDRLFVKAVARRNPGAVADMWTAFAALSGPDHDILGYTRLHLIYLAARAHADHDGASKALELLSGYLTQRLGTVIDDLARLRKDDDPDGVRPEAQIKAFRDSLAAELRLPSMPLSDAWTHLLRLSAGSSAVEDKSQLHPHRTARLAAALGTAAEATRRDVDIAARAALVHCVGLAAMPQSVLMDPERGERDEALYRSHPHVGANLIARSGIPDAGSVAEAVRFHLTPFDGRGAGTAAETIPLAARILAIASAFDSLLGGRPGRPAMSVQRALRGILEQRARDFDPVLVDRFIELVRRLEAEHPDLVKALEGEFDERELAAQ